MSENKIGRNLKYLRKKSGLTQAHIRSRLGIGRSTWSNYENGITSPSIEDLINFSRFFGITLDELILQDLSLLNPLPAKTNSRKPATNHAMYPTNEVFTATGEADIGYVLNEIKKLREELDSIKKTSNAEQ